MASDNPDGEPSQLAAVDKLVKSRGGRLEAEDRTLSPSRPEFDSPSPY